MRRFAEYFQLLLEESKNQVLALFDSPVFPEELRAHYTRKAEEIHNNWNKTDKRLWEGSWYRLGELNLLRKAAELGVLKHRVKALPQSTQPGQTARPQYETDAREAYDKAFQILEKYHEEPEVLVTIVDNMTEEELSVWAKKIDRAIGKIHNKLPHEGDISANSYSYVSVGYVRRRTLRNYSHWVDAVNRIPKLATFNFERWADWDALTTQMEQIEEEYNKRFEGGVLTEDDIKGDELHLKLDDGWEWWITPEPQCSSREAKIMGHCGGGYTDRKADIMLLLRQRMDDEGETVWIPKLTFAVNEGIIRESKGRFNKKPEAKYHPHIIALLKSDLIEGMNQNGSYDPENNFSLDDLTTAQKDDFLESKGVDEDEFVSSGFETHVRLTEAYMAKDGEGFKLNRKLKNCGVDMMDSGSWDNDATMDIWVNFDVSMFTEESITGKDGILEGGEGDPGEKYPDLNIYDYMDRGMEFSRLYDGEWSLSSNDRVSYDEETDQFEGSDLVDIFKTKLEGLGYYEKNYYEDDEDMMFDWLVENGAVMEGTAEAFEAIVGEQWSGNTWKKQQRGGDRRELLFAQLTFDIASSINRAYGADRSWGANIARGLENFLLKASKVSEPDFEKLVQMELPLGESVESANSGVDVELDVESVKVILWIDEARADDVDIERFKKLAEVVGDTELVYKFIDYVDGTEPDSPASKMFEAFMTKIENKTDASI